jgi:uncharacterized protein GlcG (DUF336 family)
MPIIHNHNRFKEEDQGSRRAMNSRIFVAASVLGALVAGCGDGSTPSTAGTDSTPSCSGSCASASSFLAVSDVQKIIAQGVAEAQARNLEATIAVVDRVGNVLAVYRMGAAADSAHQVVIASALDSVGGRAPISAGLEGLRLPLPSEPPLNGLNIDALAAIAKAVTGAYLSTEGNAFTTTTASQIIESHFNPGELGQPSGPLFGVQFSQLPCSDFSQRYNAATGPAAGPHRSPLGLAGDPGGFPLYLDGTVVGGVGVIADGVYGLDNNPPGSKSDADEAIAYAASYGYVAPPDRQANEITVNGRLLNFTSASFSGLISNPANAPAFSTLSPSGLIAVQGYADGTVHTGLPFGQPASGIRPDAGVDFPNLDAFVFVDNTNTPRYPASAGLDGAAALTQAEVLQVLRSALAVTNETRAQIRQPTGSYARVTIAVVDTLGNNLGMVQSRDAALFGSDVSLQKARAAAFMSSASAASYVAALPQAVYLRTDTGALTHRFVTLSSYVTTAQAFVGDPSAYANGVIAYSDRALGNLSRPFYPDGIDGAVYGPFSLPQGAWSPFSTGFQLDLSLNAVLGHVLFAAGAFPTDVPLGCTGVAITLDPSSGLPTAAARTTTDLRLGNGLQIFPGSVPIYRGNTLVGGVGVSGDGVDQDDMVAILGLANASTALGSSITNAPSARRADTLTPQGTRLKYVECPQSPFVNSDAENVCEGL